MIAIILFNNDTLLHSIQEFTQRPAFILPVSYGFSNIFFQLRFITSNHILFEQFLFLKIT